MLDLAKEKTTPEGGSLIVSGVQAQGTFDFVQQTDYKVINSRSTSTLSQRDRALKLLEIAPQTTYSLRQRGISHPAARLKELIAQGHQITKTTVNAVDSDGYTHVGVALYSLAKSTKPEVK